MNFVKNFDFENCAFRFVSVDLYLGKELQIFKSFIKLDKEHKLTDYNLDYKDLVSVSMTCRFFRDQTKDARKLLKENQVTRNVIPSFDKSF